MTKAMMNYVTVTEVEKNSGCYTVEVKVGDKWYAHQGPKNVDWFTKEQALNLASRVQSNRQLDMQYWIDTHITESEIEERWCVDAMEGR